MVSLLNIEIFLESLNFEGAFSFSKKHQKIYFILLGLTVNVWTLGIPIKIGMLLAVVLDPLESITAIIWYSFLCKKDPTIVKHEATLHLIFNHWFNVQFLSISLIFYSNVTNLCLIYPNHYILPDRTSEIHIKINYTFSNSIIILMWNKMENETRGRYFSCLRIKYFIPKLILKGFMIRNWYF
jgi:hypothetical protein